MVTNSMIDLLLLHLADMLKSRVWKSNKMGKPEKDREDANHQSAAVGCHTVFGVLSCKGVQNDEVFEGMKALSILKYNTLNDVSPITIECLNFSMYQLHQ